MLTNLQMAEKGFFIPYYSYMTLSPKIRVNSRNPWLKMMKSVVKNNKIRANLRIKTVNFANFFMQNKANFKNVKINLTHYMTNRYVNIYPLGQPKNKAKTKPNEPNSNPIRSQFKAKTKPIKLNFLLIWVISHYALRLTHCELIVSLSNLFLLIWVIYNLRITIYELRTFSDFSSSKRSFAIAAAPIMPASSPREAKHISTVSFFSFQICSLK